MPIIYHITTRSEWEAARQQSFYEAASLRPEGFMHCSEAAQVPGVLQRYFAGREDLVKLVIDTEKLHAPLQYDYAPSIQENFPHIYGPLNLDAVVEVEMI